MIEKQLSFTLSVFKNENELPPADVQLLTQAKQALANAYAPYSNFKVAAVDSGEINFLHTDKLVLVDKHRIIRGFYSGQDSIEMGKLANDIVLLMLEKDKTKKRDLFRK